MFQNFDVMEPKKTGWAISQGQAFSQISTVIVSRTVVSNILLQQARPAGAKGNLLKWKIKKKLSYTKSDMQRCYLDSGTHNIKIAGIPSQ